MQSLLSAHTILGVDGGEFVSLIDPPDCAEGSSRRNAKTSERGPFWPVKKGNATAMLSSPIILYDYPQIAPESPGDLFDGTEIDEILALRILTLTEEEKHEMRHADERCPRDSGAHGSDAHGAFHEASWSACEDCGQPTRKSNERMGMASARRQSARGECEYCRCRGKAGAPRAPSSR